MILLRMYEGTYVHTIIDFFSSHTASLKVERSIPVTFCILGHLESSMYMDNPVPHPRSVAALGLLLMALRGREEKEEKN